MKILIAILLFLGVSTHVSALGGGVGIDGAQPGSADGILQSIENANVTHVGEDLLKRRAALWKGTPKTMKALTQDPVSSVGLSQKAKSNLTKLAAWTSDRNIPFLITSIGMTVMLLWAGSFKMTAPAPKALFLWFLTARW
jgi:hypothetical protein